MLAAIGLAEGRPVPAYGIALPDERLGSLATATGLRRAQIQALLLSAYDGTALNFSGLELADPASLRRVAQREWAYFGSSRVCPDCLAESGAWQLRWKLPWSFACVRHQRLLLDICPACRAPTGSGRVDRRSSPALLRVIPDTLRCMNAAKGNRCRGRTRPCGCDLTAAPTPTLALTDPGLLAQQWIDELLDGKGRHLDVPATFRELRSLCALLLYAAKVDDLGPPSEAAAAAFDLHVRRRVAIREARCQLSDAAVDPRRGPRLRSYLATPACAALVAAIAPFAIEIVAVPAAEEAADRLAPTLERARRLSGRRYPNLPQELAFSARLRRAFELGSPTPDFACRAGMHARSARRAYAFGSELVPQLLWPELYERHFAPLLGATTASAGRRFCSLALVKVVQPRSWSDAASDLGLPPSAARNLAAAVVGRLEANGCASSFTDVLHALATRLERNPWRIDYGERRRCLGTLHTLPAADWAQICRAAGARIGRPGGRARFATAWLWSELTGGDHRLAPGFCGAPASSFGDSYRRFVARDLPALRTPLRAYGAHLLAERGLLEPVRRSSGLRHDVKIS